MSDIYGKVKSINKGSVPKASAKNSMQQRYGGSRRRNINSTQFAKKQKKKFKNYFLKQFYPCLTEEDECIS